MYLIIGTGMVFLHGLLIRIVWNQTLILRRADKYSGPLSPALEGGTDLVPALYEGGLKIWECSEDLVRSDFLPEVFTDYLYLAPIFYHHCKIPVYLLRYTLIFI
jgi:hypothetical protein